MSSESKSEHTTCMNILHLMLFVDYFSFNFEPRSLSLCPTGVAFCCLSTGRLFSISALSTSQSLQAVHFFHLYFSPLLLGIFFPFSIIIMIQNTARPYFINEQHSHNIATFCLLLFGSLWFSIPLSIILLLA